MCFWHTSDKVPRRVRIQRHGYYTPLTPSERAHHATQGRRYRTRHPVVVTCVYHGRRETVTVPAQRLFHGDAFKELLRLPSTGVAWLVQDWLYGTHAFARRADGTTTAITHRRTVDELTYRILALDHQTSYADMLRAGKPFFAHALDTYWNKAVRSVRYEGRERIYDDYRAALAVLESESESESESDTSH